ncbi:hypothetical protein FOL47_001603, partial [Perkinsus chesapeaki]
MKAIPIIIIVESFGISPPKREVELEPAATQKPFGMKKIQNDSRVRISHFLILSRLVIVGKMVNLACIIVRAKMASTPYAIITVATATHSNASVLQTALKILTVRVHLKGMLINIVGTMGTNTVVTVGWGALGSRNALLICIAILLFLELSTALGSCDRPKDIRKGIVWLCKERESYYVSVPVVLCLPAYFSMR